MLFLRKTDLHEVRGLVFAVAAYLPRGGQIGLHERKQPAGALVPGEGVLRQRQNRRPRRGAVEGHVGHGLQDGRGGTAG